MGFFGLIQKLFSKEAETADVNFNELEKWLKERVTQDDSESSLNEKINDLTQLIVSAKAKLQILESAELKNDKIEEKLKNFMSGNRTNYIRQVTIFLDSLKIPENRENIKTFVESANVAFENLNKSAKKSFYILQEFFAEESGKVAEDLKRIDVKTREIKSLIDNKDIQFLSEVNSRISDIQNELSKKETLKSNIEELRSKVEENEATILARQSEIETLEKTAGFKKIQNIKDEISNNEEALKKIDFQITQMFSPLSRAFRKFEKVAETNADILTRYNDPLNGLLYDTSFRVLEVLRALRISILKKEIELKDGEKINKKINEITKEKLDNFRMSYFHLKERNEQLKRELKSNDTVYAYNDVVAMMKHTKSQLDKNKTELENKTHDLSLISVDNQISELSEKIKDHMNVEVNILL